MADLRHLITRQFMARLRSGILIGYSFLRGSVHNTVTSASRVDWSLVVLARNLLLAFAGATDGGPRVNSESIGNTHDTYAMTEFNEGAADSKEFGHRPPTAHPPTSIVELWRCFSLPRGSMSLWDVHQAYGETHDTHATAEFNKGATDSKEFGHRPPTARPPTSIVELWRCFSLPRGSMSLWDVHQAYGETHDTHATAEFNQGATDSKEFGHRPPTARLPTPIVELWRCFSLPRGSTSLRDVHQAYGETHDTHATAEFNKGAANSKEFGHRPPTTRPSTARPPTPIVELWHCFSLPRGSMSLWDVHQAYLMI
ncbi:hypothetical protein B0H16DRAFT_1486627 [Mycena metata]|uniref:Uncharacterized protein n=1 Tax=Mycena metata TaxID=1033252 RepID=A0AAD7DI25_9AGAR|nr:hypothetical protein B0H16DRAFT_1486627 [Mycena metata]